MQNLPVQKRGVATRERILESAEVLVYDRGFSATSIERVIERAGVTKGAFFHHFKSKAELGRACVTRFAERDIALFDDNMARAERLARDPLQQVLIFIGLLREQAAALLDHEQGCLFVAYVYERVEYPDDVIDIVRGAHGHWRRGLAAKLRAVAALHPPVRPVDFDSLAETLLTLIEGGFVMTRLSDGMRLFVEQLGHYRDYLELLFASPAEGQTS